LRRKKKAVPAARTKYHRLGGLSNRNGFLTVLEPVKSKIRVPAIWFLVEDPLPGLVDSCLKSCVLRDAWVAQSVKRLPLAQVMIPESWDQVPHWAPCSGGSLLLPLPAAPPACALSLTNKILKE